MAVIACSIFPSLGRKGKWLPRHHSFSGEKRKTIDDVFCFVTDDVFFLSRCVVSISRFVKKM